MRTVELQTAFSWHCEECGHLNFALPQKAELTEADAETAYRHFHQLEDFAELPEGWQSFELVEIPDTVVCSECCEMFETTDERLNDSSL
jgi:hypothetical protein